MFTSATADDFYWVGGTGSWSDFASHWATTSGGVVFHPNAPTDADDVIFDANSFAGGETVTLDVDGTALSIDMSTNNVVFNFSGAGVRTLTVEGNVALDAQADFSGFSGTIILNGEDAGASHTFDVNGTSLALVPVIVNFLELKSIPRTASPATSTSKLTQVWSKKVKSIVPDCTPN